jgi:hypothetical protein
MHRCSVVFSELSQILACLEAIAADGEVEVVRVNNKFAHNYDAFITAGYRCITRASSTPVRAWARAWGNAAVGLGWAEGQGAGA